MPKIRVRVRIAVGVMVLNENLLNENWRVGAEINPYTREVHI